MTASFEGTGVYIMKMPSPDGDKIVNYEFKNAQETYEIGEHIIEERIQDSEGYWSDWTVQTISVAKASTEIYRLEAEVLDSQIKRPVKCRFGYRLY